MESLKNEYIEEYRNPNSIEIIKIKHSSAEESNNLLIHLITIKEIKKIKQYRHFANSYTSKLFETYIYWEYLEQLKLDIDLKVYLKQKTTEFSELEKHVNTDTKSYQDELNKYPPEENNKL